MRLGEGSGGMRMAPTTLAIKESDRITCGTKSFEIDMVNYC